MSVVWVVAVVLLLLACLAFSHRYAWWRPTVDWRRPRVLMYHMISPHRPKAKFNKLRVPPEAFAAQVEWLVEQGFNCVTMETLVNDWDRLPPKTVAITVDDGYADNLHAMLPVLQQYKVPATIYVVVDRHDRDWSVYKKAHHNTGELALETKLTDAEVQELVASQLIEIGSHTLTHANLPRLEPADRARELVESRAALQTLTGQPINSFAYPFGLYGEADVIAARSAGYSNAVTTLEGIDPLTPRPDFLQLQRIKVSGKDTLYAFKCRIRTGQRGL
jgi:peptidoglycan/xylan/chitin deacetylase (PgdA/CDA1 family)